MTKDQLIAENEKLAKTIKQYEEAIPALVKENEELREQVQQLKKTADERLCYEWAVDADNERLRANAGN